jgi:hypothetical protein
MIYMKPIILKIDVFLVISGQNLDKRADVENLCRLS